MIRHSIIPTRLQEYVDALNITKTDGARIFDCSVSHFSSMLHGKENRFISITGVCNLLAISNHSIEYLTGKALTLTVDKRRLKSIIREQKNEQGVK